MEHLKFVKDEEYKGKTEKWKVYSNDCGDFLGLKKIDLNIPYVIHYYG